GELFPNRRLQAVVAVDTVESVSLQADRGESEVWHTRVDVRGRVRRDAVYRIGGTGEPRRIDVVAVVHDIDAARSDVGRFKDVLTRKLPLNSQVVLPHQRGLDVIVEGRIKIGALQCREIEPPRQYLQRAVRERALQAGSLWNNGQRIGVRSAFLNRMNHPVDADSIVENAGAAANDETAGT